MIKGNVKTQKHTSAGAVRFCVGCIPTGHNRNNITAIKGDVKTSYCVGQINYPTGPYKNNNRKKLGSSVPNETLVCYSKVKELLPCASGVSRYTSDRNSEQKKQHKTGTDPRVSKVTSSADNVHSEVVKATGAECQLVIKLMTGVSRDYSLLKVSKPLSWWRGFKAEPEASVIHRAQQGHHYRPGLLNERSVTPPSVESSRCPELGTHGEEFMRAIPEESRVRAPQPLAKTGHVGLTPCRSIGIRPTVSK